MDLKGQMENIQPRGGVVATMVTAEVAVTMVMDLVVTVTMVMVGVVLVTMVTVIVTVALEMPPGLTVLMTTIKRCRWPLP